MSYTGFELWLIIGLLGLGTFLVRFSFLGLIGDRDLPPWLLRHLRYTAVAILPAMVMPLVLAPDAATNAPDPVKIAAATATLAAGYITRNVLWAMLAGVVTLYGLGFLIG